MTPGVHALLVAELEAEEIRSVHPNDYRRSPFTMVAGDVVHAISGSDLSIVHSWPLATKHRGSHATQHADGLALISGPDHVSLLNRRGAQVWSFAHAAWRGNFESGCAWFDSSGHPLAVVPSPRYDGCLIVDLDPLTGSRRDEIPISTHPAGIEPIFHPDGWVGLSVGEGQDATRAWWALSRPPRSGQSKLELIDAQWDD